MEKKNFRYDFILRACVRHLKKEKNFRSNRNRISGYGEFFFFEWHARSFDFENDSIFFFGGGGINY